MKKISIAFFLLFFIITRTTIAQTFPQVHSKIGYSGSYYFGYTFPIINSYDFAIALEVSGMWREDSRNYQVIANKGGKWYQFYLTVPFKLKRNGRIKRARKPQCAFIDTNQDTCQKVFENLITQKIPSMNEDSLNDHRVKRNDGTYGAEHIDDGPDYSFLIANNGKVQEIECYAPYEFYEYNHDIIQRNKFIDFLNSFNSIWPKK